MILLGRINNVADVARWRLCAGCGACVPACPQRAIHLVDAQDQGIRPVVDPLRCQHCGECIRVCPGVEIRHQRFNSETIVELRQAWGPVLQVWQGYAADPEIRFKASSGGAATALALFYLQEQKASGVLHTRADPEVPWRNIPVFSKTQEELVAFSGSRYAPAAPCERFDWIEQADGKCIFIGKPCDVAALRKSQAVNPKLDEKVGLAISIFCAGTPTTQATRWLLSSLGVEPEQVKELRYRGYGWPGMTTVKVTGKDNKPRRMTYEQSWGNILSRHRQLRCHLCPDGTGGFADISCGDAWHLKTDTGDPGQSLILVRTDLGRHILHKAVSAGYLKLEKTDAAALPQSQRALLKRRRHLWGRLLMMRAMGITVPKYRGFRLFGNWRTLPLSEKMRSLLGTAKRIILRKLYMPVDKRSKSVKRPRSTFHQKHYHIVKQRTD